ncbi:MAG: carboxynorspermidine decarboxylase [Lachnospiraceae bacterium]
MKIEQLDTPCYVIDEDKLKKNLQQLRAVAADTGCKILLAQKAFSAYAVYPMIAEYLDGTTASGLYEARLGYEEMGTDKETHIFSAAYRAEEFEEIAAICDHIIFNSFGQLETYRSIALKHGAGIGLRINPECSTQEGHAIYDPCAPGSRLGITAGHFIGKNLEGVEGLHFHTLCEQNADDLETTLKAVEQKFAAYLKLPQIKWLNFGGGHHITKPDYDITLLEKCINQMQERYQLTIYLEPGEAVALNAGYLITKVLDIVENAGVQIAILDTSAACHMPDVIEMPYRPPLKDSAAPGEKQYTYRLAGPTCLAGDVIGEYSFDRPLEPGSRLYFEDMAIYSMVKNNTFNGMPLPSIVLKHGGQCQLWKSFGYEDFKSRL